MTGSDAARRAERPKPAGADQETPSVDTSTLLGSRQEVILMHKGVPYRLRQTQSGKLILTK